MIETFDLIPSRWLEREPPGLCHTGLEAIGAIAAVAGTGLSAMSSMSQSSYQESVARSQALYQQQKANQDAALGQRQAITEQRKSDLVLSRARALGAASGTDDSSPTQLNIESGIASQGQYNALSTLYDGMTKSTADTYQSNLDLFRADQYASAGPLAAGGQLFSGAASLTNKLALSASRSRLIDLFGQP